MSDNLRKALDLAPEAERMPTITTPAEDDFEFARKVIYDIIGKIQEVSEDVIDLARQSQSPRAYEVLNSILKNAAECSRDLVELQKTRKDIFNETPTPQTVNNNLYVGSTTELAKVIEDLRKSNDI